MKRVFKYLSIGLLIVVCFGWIINSNRLYSASESTFLKNQATRRIVYSDWETVDQWFDTAALGQTARGYEMLGMGLQSCNFEDGKLLVYGQIDESEQVYLLPKTTQSESGEYRYDYLMESSSSLRVISLNLNGDFVKSATPQRFRYLYVPNSLVSSLNLDLADYQAVKNTLGLPN